MPTSSATPTGGMNQGMLPPPPPQSASSRPPPPPPPRLTYCMHGRPPPSSQTDRSRPWWKSWNRKYVLLCGICGMSAVLLGTSYLIIYAVLRSYTTSLEYFETIPTYVPAVVLIVTGLLILCFVIRRNRLHYLIKISGFLCLVCAVLCVVITVTTTVLHMNRLQTLQECEFRPHFKSCFCTPYISLVDPSQEKIEYKFSLVSSGINCDIVHGPLYSCLRAVFGLSVIGILVSIFSCMLVYQLLSHEKKKMYWEQLEQRRRLLYQRSGLSPPAQESFCACCDDYGFVPSSTATTSADAFPWALWDPVTERFWSNRQSLFSPGSEEASAAHHSIFLNSGPVQQLQSSLWLPWGSHMQQSGTESQNMERRIEGVDESTAQRTGVLLRPQLPNHGPGGRFGLRRHHNHSSRPLSDPEVSLHLARYPIFNDPFISPLSYQALEAFPRYLWGPPPPYSQPTSMENIPVTGSPLHHTSPAHQQSPLVRSPNHLPLITDFMSSPGSPVIISSPSTVGSPAHIISLAKHKSVQDGMETSLALHHHHPCHLPIAHVKSLGDITEKDETLNALFNDVNKKSSVLEKFRSQQNGHEKVGLSKHQKSVSDSKGIYACGRGEQESELYFADVSSCVSARQGDEGMYYSEPTSSDSQHTPSPCDKDDSHHMYEQVKEKEDADSYHNSDDTMIVHTSSSNHSLNAEIENAYSIVSPGTDGSSNSPMVTDTDAYSCYALGLTSVSKDALNKHVGNLNHPFVFSPINRGQNLRRNLVEDHPYEVLQDVKSPTNSRASIPVSNANVPQTSDLNGNLPSLQSGGSRQYRNNLSLPVRQDRSSIRHGVMGHISTDNNVGDQPLSPSRRHGDRLQYHNAGPNVPQEQGILSVHDLLMTLKSVNV